MQIYKDYELADALFDLPCKIGNTEIYPTLVKDYKEFKKYAKYLVFTKKHLYIPDTVQESLLKVVVNFNIITYQEEFNLKTQDEMNMVYNIVFKDLERLFTIVCRQEIKFVFDEDSKMYNFVDKDNNVLINDNNFDLIRRVLLKLNMLFEPKIYDNELERKWEEKAMIAREKNSKPLDFADMINIISCSTGKSYKELSEQNVLQLYADYYRCINTEYAHMTYVFKTVSDFKGVSFDESVIDSLYRSPYDGLWKSRGEVLGNMT